MSYFEQQNPSRKIDRVIIILMKRTMLYNICSTCRNRSDQWPVKNPLNFMVEFDFNRVLQSDWNLKISQRKFLKIDIICLDDRGIVSGTKSPPLARTPLPPPPTRDLHWKVHNLGFNVALSKTIEETDHLPYYTRTGQVTQTSGFLLYVTRELGLPIFPRLANFGKVW